MAETDTAPLATAGGFHRGVDRGARRGLPRPLLLALLLSALLLPGCGIQRSRLTVRNDSAHDVTGGIIRIAGQPPHAMPLGPIPAGGTRRVVLPRGFGEASLEAEITVGGRSVIAICGYVEPSHYRLTIRVDATLATSCAIDFFP